MRHTFTHFHLRLRVETAAAPPDAPGAFFGSRPDRASALPTVMRKALALGLSAHGPVNGAEPEGE